MTRAILRAIRLITSVWGTADTRTAARYTWNVLRTASQVIRAKTLRAADDRMTGKVTTFDVWGTKIHIPGIYFSGAREIYCEKVYFPTFGSAPRSGDVVVDLGANVGIFTTFAAARGCRVISVEAQAGFIPAIEANLLANDCRDRVSIEAALVGSRSGLFSNPRSRSEASHWRGEPSVLSMSELFGRYDLGEVDFLKVDIEGSEFDLILNDAGWLDNVGQIAMEVHPRFGSPDRLLTHLEGRFDLSVDRSLGDRELIVRAKRRA